MFYEYKVIYIQGKYRNLTGYNRCYKLMSNTKIIDNIKSDANDMKDIKTNDNSNDIKLRYLAEIVSPEEIAVWFISHEDTIGISDGIYKLIGQTNTETLLPNPNIIQYGFGCSYDFRQYDYVSKINFWLRQGMPPPYECTCPPTFTSIGGTPIDPRTCLLTQILCNFNRYDLPDYLRIKYEPYYSNVLDIKTYSNDITDTIKDNIIKTFDDYKYKFEHEHAVYKCLVIGTVNKTVDTK